MNNENPLRRDEEEVFSEDTDFETFLSPIDALLDESNGDNIVIYNEAGDPVEFEQIALIPMEEKIHAILKPVTPLPGIRPDEALVFCIDEIDGEECLTLVTEEDVMDAVFEEYYKLLAASEGEH